jgi:large subunit ribosomal protein L32
MALPSHRRSSSRKRRSQSHLALEKVSTATCPKCGAAVLQHRACKACGTYKSREVLKTRADKKTAQKAKKAAKEKAASKKTK